MNIKRFKTTLTAGILAASMILPGITAFAAPKNSDDWLTDNAEGVITKVVTSPDGVTYNETFTYTFTQDAYDANVTDSGVVPNQTEAGIADVTVKADSSTAKAGDNTGVKVNTLNLTGALDLSKITSTGVYTYTVKESKRTGADGADVSWTYSEAEYKLRVYAYNETEADGSKNLVKKLTLVQTKNDEGEGTTDTGKVKTATFNNTLTKTSSFTLTKAISDSDGLEPADQTYTFEVDITGNSLTANPTYGVEIDGVEQSNVTFDGGKATIALKAGQVATFTGVPAGSYVSVEEKNNPTNVASTTIRTLVGGNKIEADTEGAASTDGLEVTNVLVDENGSAIEYSNTWKTLTVTGVVTNVAPYVTLVVVAVAAVAAYIAIKRRIAM